MDPQFRGTVRVAGKVSCLWMMEGVAEAVYTKGQETGRTESEVWL